MSVKIIYSAGEFKSILESSGEKLICLEFFASWCGTCRLMAPMFEALAKKHDGKFIALKVDVDEVKELPTEHRILSLPTFICFKYGTKIDKVVGANHFLLTEMLDKHM